MTRNFLLVTLIAAGCASDSHNSANQASPTSPALRSAPSAAAQVAMPEQEYDSWQSRVAAHLASLRAQDAALYEKLNQLDPQQTLAQHLRFTDPAIHTPVAAAVFLDRLVRRDDSAAVRLALADALPRTGGFYADAVPDLLTGESAAEVRAALASTLGRSKDPIALPGMRLALADQAGEVRAAAARAAEMSRQGDALASELVQALADGTVEVRSHAARALGVHRVDSAKTKLVDVLDDDDPEVRLQALRALGRIDAAFVRTSGAAQRMLGDDDPRVGRLAQRLAH